MKTARRAPQSCCRYMCASSLCAYGSALLVPASTQDRGGSISLHAPPVPRAETSPYRLCVSSCYQAQDVMAQKWREENRSNLAHFQQVFTELKAENGRLAVRLSPSH